jgi:hypothetical protein
MDMKILGLAGNAGAGKDEFCKCCIKLMGINGIPCQRLSIADVLKSEMHDFILEKFEIDIRNASREEKNLVRGLLVEYGLTKRNVSNGTYFTKKLEKAIKILNGGRSNIKHFIITDIRYCDENFLEDEIDWLKETMKGKLCYIERIEGYDEKKENLIFCPPANEMEAFYHPILKENSDFMVEWETVEDVNYREAFANSVLKEMKWL